MSIETNKVKSFISTVHARTCLEVLNGNLNSKFYLAEVFTDAFVISQDASTRTLLECTLSWDDDYVLEVKFEKNTYTHDDLTKIDSNLPRMKVDVLRNKTSFQQLLKELSKLEKQITDFVTELLK